MPMMSYEDAKAAVRKIRDEDYDTYIAMRAEASRDLCAVMEEMYGPDHGHGIGSSDVSIHLYSMYQRGELEV